MFLIRARLLPVMLSALFALIVGALLQSTLEAARPYLVLTLVVLAPSRS